MSKLLRWSGIIIASAGDRHDERFLVEKDSKAEEHQAEEHQAESPTALQCSQGFYSGPIPWMLLAPITKPLEDDVAATGRVMMRWRSLKPVGPPLPLHYHCKSHE